MLFAIRGNLYFMVFIFKFMVLITRNIRAIYHQRIRCLMGFEKPISRFSILRTVWLFAILQPRLGSVEKVGVRALAAPVSDIRNQLIS